MKTKIYALLLLVTAVSTAQVITFTDNDFRLKLLQSDVNNNIAKTLGGNTIKIDADGNGQITVQEVALVYELFIPNETSISSIEGIKFFTNLTRLDAQSCGISGNVDLSNLLLLDLVYLNNNLINAINVTGCVAMREIDLNTNLIQEVDISSLFILEDLKVKDNPILRIFAKNGTDEAIDFSGSLNQNINYICADEIQVSNLLGQVTNGCIINSFCTDKPGGNYNSITGTLYFDAAGNGLDPSDLPHPYAKLVSILGNDDSTIVQTVTLANATYNFATTETGGFDVLPSVENPTWFTIVPAAGTFPNTNNNVFNQNFLLAPVGIHFDVEAMIRPVSQVTPGSNVTYEIVYKNKGNQTHTGQVSVDYNESVLNFVSSTVPLVNSGTGLLSLAYSNLLPLETRSFRFTLNLNNTVITGATLPFVITINPNGEAVATQFDNTINYFQKVEPKNPNRIECIQGASVSPSDLGKYLYYAINFENTGSQTVQDVVVNTSFNPAQYDVNSIQIMNATSELTVNTKNEKVGLSMRKANVRGPGGQGAILLKIIPSKDLTNGSTVNTSADVFFNYSAAQNAPSLTTTQAATTTFQSLKVAENNLDVSITVYPNPTTSLVNITAKNNIQSVQLYDVYGRLLQISILESTSSKIDFTQRSPGIYFLKITSDKGQKLEKIVKK